MMIVAPVFAVCVVGSGVSGDCEVVLAARGSAVSVYRIWSLDADRDPDHALGHDLVEALALPGDSADLTVRRLIVLEQWPGLVVVASCRRLFVLKVSWDRAVSPAGSCVAAEWVDQVDVPSMVLAAAAAPPNTPPSSVGQRAALAVGLLSGNCVLHTSVAVDPRGAGGGPGSQSTPDAADRLVPCRVGRVAASSMCFVLPLCITGTAMGQLLVWDVHNGDVLAQLDQATGGVVLGLGVQPAAPVLRPGLRSSVYFWASSDDRTARLFAVDWFGEPAHVAASVRRASPLLRDHLGRIWAAAIVPTPERQEAQVPPTTTTADDDAIVDIVTAADDGLAMFSLKDAAEDLPPPPARWLLSRCKVWSVAASARLVVCGAADGSVRVVRRRQRWAAGRPFVESLCPVSSDREGLLTCCVLAGGGGDDATSSFGGDTSGVNDCVLFVGTRRGRVLRVRPSGSSRSVPPLLEQVHDAAVWMMGKGAPSSSSSSSKELQAVCTLAWSAGHGGCLFAGLKSGHVVVLRQQTVDGGAAAHTTFSASVLGPFGLRIMHLWPAFTDGGSRLYVSSDQGDVWRCLSLAWHPPAACSVAGTTVYSVPLNERGDMLPRRHGRARCVPHSVRELVTQSGRLTVCGDSSGSVHCFFMAKQGEGREEEYCQQALAAAAAAAAAAVHQRPPDCSLFRLHGMERVSDLRLIAESVSDLDNSFAVDGCSVGWDGRCCVFGVRGVRRDGGDGWSVSAFVSRTQLIRVGDRINRLLHFVDRDLVSCLHDHKLKLLCLSTRQFVRFPVVGDDGGQEDAGHPSALAFGFGADHVRSYAPTLILPVCRLVDVAATGEQRLIMVDIVRQTLIRTLSTVARRRTTLRPPGRHHELRVNCAVCFRMPPSAQDGGRGRLLLASAAEDCWIVVRGDDGTGGGGGVTVTDDRRELVRMQPSAACAQASLATWTSPADDGAGAAAVYLVSGGAMGSLACWAFPSLGAPRLVGESRVAVGRTGAYRIWALHVVKPDGAAGRPALVLAGCSDACVRVFSVSSGDDAVRLAYASDPLDRGSVLTMDRLPVDEAVGDGPPAADHLFVVCGTSRGLLLFCRLHWSWADGAVVGERPLDVAVSLHGHDCVAHQAGVNRVRAVPGVDDGRLLLSAGDDHAVSLHRWTADGPFTFRAQCMRRFIAHAASVRDFQLLPATAHDAATRFVSVGDDQKLFLWRLDDDQPLGRSVTCIAEPSTLVYIDDEENKDDDNDEEAAPSSSDAAIFAANFVIFGEGVQHARNALFFA